MLALPHARQPAPPLAARGMWLRLRLGPDAFGSALGDAIVDSIRASDADMLSVSIEFNSNDIDRTQNERISGDTNRSEAISPIVSQGDSEQSPTACFLAGTPVLTKDGMRSIEQISIGNWVASRHQVNQDASVHWRRVIETYTYRDKAVSLLTLRYPNGEQDAIAATSEHPFFIASKGWTAVNELRPGDQFTLIDGGQAVLDSVESGAGLHTVYNFAVEEDHTYFVGTQGIWVHNLYDPAAQEALAPLAEKGAEKAIGKAAGKVAPTLLGRLLPAIGEYAGPVGALLGLALHTEDAPTIDWNMGNQSFKYNPDDFSLSANISDAGLFGPSPTVISDIQNPTTYPNVTYLEYLTYKANGGELALHDFVSTGMPQPESGGISERSWFSKPIRITNAVDGSTYVPGPITSRVMSLYQSAFDEGYTYAMSLKDANNLTVPNGVSERTIIGQIADGEARSALKLALAPGGKLEDLSNSVLVNRYLRNPNGGKRYTIPDVRIPTEGVIIDGTIGYKDQNTPQVKNFFDYSPKTNTVIIVTPNNSQAFLRRTKP